MRTDSASASLKKIKTRSLVWAGHLDRPVQCYFNDFQSNELDRYVRKTISNRIQFVIVGDIRSVVFDTNGDDVRTLRRKSYAEFDLKLVFC